jgi:hypothetical protein
MGGGPRNSPQIWRGRKVLLLPIVEPRFLDLRARVLAAILTRPSSFFSDIVEVLCKCSILQLRKLLQKYHGTTIIGFRWFHKVSYVRLL